MPIGAIAGASVVGAGASIWGANKAADAQTNAANQAIGYQQSQYAKNEQTLNPWIQSGNTSNNTLQWLTGTGGTQPAGNAGGSGVPGIGGAQGSLTQTFAPTMEQLAKTPGYQFLLDQGTKSTQNSYAAKGLGSSGAAMKGAADYAEGLAGTTYQQQFQNYWNQNQSIYNMLTGQSQQGLSAAGALTGQGMTAATNSGNAAIGAGNAQAGAANATGSAISNGVNSVAQYNLLSSLLANRGATNGTAAPVTPNANPNMDVNSYGFYGL